MPSTEASRYSASLAQRFGVRPATVQRVRFSAPPRLLQHHGRGNQEPDAAIKGIARDYVAGPLVWLCREQILAVRRERRRIGAPLRAVLGKPNQVNLARAAREQLAAMVEFAHLAEARGESMFAFRTSPGAGGAA